MQATHTKISKDRVERLKKRSDFVLLNQKAKKWVSKGLVLQALKREENHEFPKDKIRIGFTVTKRTEKLAVKRNRIKRRLRAAASESLALYGQEGYDFVIIGRPETIDRPYDQLRRDLIWCLKKMDLYQCAE